MKKTLILLSLLLLTGCWNYKELNEIAITTGIAIDKNDESYTITALISNANPKEKSSKEGSSQITTISGNGETISESFQDIELKLPRILYLKHIGVLVIGEELAKEGIDEILDYLIRNPDSPNKFNIIISRNTDAKDVLKIISPLESFPSQNIALMIKNTEEIQGSTLEVSYVDFMKTYLDDGINQVLPTIEIIGSIEEGKKEDNVKTSDPNTYIKLGTTAILKDTKLVAYANERQSVGINILNNNINQMMPYIKCGDDKYIVANISSFKLKKDIDDNLNAKININASGYISEVSCEIDLTNEENIKEIEKNLSNEIKKVLLETINLAKKNKTDIFGFGNIYYKKYENKWKNIKKDWNANYFNNIKYNINVKVDLKANKTTNQTIKEAHDKNE